MYGRNSKLLSFTKITHSTKPTSAITTANRYIYITIPSSKTAIIFLSDFTSNHPEIMNYNAVLCKLDSVKSIRRLYLSRFLSYIIISTALSSFAVASLMKPMKPIFPNVCSFCQKTGKLTQFPQPKQKSQCKY